MRWTLQPVASSGPHFAHGVTKQARGLIAAHPSGVRTPIRTPRKNGVQPLHAALERRAGAARLSPHAARHVHAYNRRAYGACRLCTPVGSRKPLDSRGLREPRYPYKGTQGTLIRVPLGTLIRVPLGYRGTLIRVPLGTLIRVPSGTLIRVPSTLGTLIRVPSTLGTLIRVPRYPYKGTTWYPYEGTEWYPYKGTLGTLIRVPGTLIRVPGTLTRVPNSTLIRVPRYPYKGYHPYKGTLGTLIRVLFGTLIRVPRGSRKPLDLRGLREPGRIGVHGQHACPAGPHAEPAVLTPFAFGGACARPSGVPLSSPSRQ
ncbi:hypothetical protein PCANC_14530 [Puccinia coronata f. sp. avenae]|uniref:Uncharacterized protein n=1 Tax=Puccinia coronata f. sp. avenae TaxID=200324 RepID=A0A2N5SQR0_9BASI|nr:hypothetical protein PCANC_14530 [Puccinia coronata f. sp. avenae]